MVDRLAGQNTLTALSRTRPPKVLARPKSSTEQINYKMQTKSYKKWQLFVDLNILVWRLEHFKIYFIVRSHFGVQFFCISRELILVWGWWGIKGKTLLLLRVVLLRELRFLPTIPLLGGGIPPPPRNGINGIIRIVFVVVRWRDTQQKLMTHLINSWLTILNKK